MAKAPVLRTRKPTGVPPCPFVLIEGPDKVGKTAAALALSADDRIGHAWALDMGQGSLDEYAPLGDYEIIDWDGTFPDLTEQLQAAMAIPRISPDRPNLIVFDGGTELWDSLSAWVDARARESKINAKALEEDANAEVIVSGNLWNDATARWKRIMRLFQGWDGISVITASGREVSKFENGRPKVVGSQTVMEWKVEGQKRFLSEVSAHVHMPAYRTGVLKGVRSLRIGEQDLPIDLPRPFNLAHLVFDVVGVEAASAGRRITHLDSSAAGLFEVKEAKVRLCLAARDELGAASTVEREKEIAAKVWQAPAGKHVTAAELASMLSLIGPAARGDLDEEPTEQPVAELVTAGVNGHASLDQYYEDSGY